MLKSYKELRAVDVTPYVKQRDGNDYLNWARCIELLHEHGAEKVYFEPCVNENGSSLFMSDSVFTDAKGNTNRCYEVRVRIVIDELEFEAQYPLMNGSNPVKDNSMSQQRVWNAQTRAFVKGVAVRTGLGFSLWLDDDSDLLPKPTRCLLPPGGRSIFSVSYVTPSDSRKHCMHRARITDKPYARR